jgi:oligogalacturonide lyase
MQGSGRVSLAILSRRGFLAASASLIGMAQTAPRPVALSSQNPPQSPQKPRDLPSVAKRYLDPATEFVVIRLTDPQYSALLPSGGTRPLTNRSMLYASDETGSWQALRMDLHSYASQQLTDAMALDPQSLSFMLSEKGFWHFDGGHFRETIFAGNKTRELYLTPDNFEKRPGVSYSQDGQAAFFVEKGPAGFRLQRVDLLRGAARTLVESPDEIAGALPRPKHASVLYRTSGEWWIVDTVTKKTQKLSLAEGENTACQWSADGAAFLYLNRPTDPKKLTAIRQSVPEGAKDTWIANTSQFAAFSANADGSVFAGASGTKASPYVLLLARAVKREFTLAEHKARDPRTVAPLFTPNSQALLFQSDRHGKPAIYWMAVEKFVAETESGEQRE